MANETLTGELTKLKTKEDKLVNNPVANFSYTQTALENDDANGVTVYDYSKDNNIPTADANVINTNPSILEKGFRSQASSITRMLMNHFLGRVSYNLNKTVSVVSSMITNIINFIGQPNGIAPLGSDGRIPNQYLPEEAIEFKGLWDASTNTPTLSNGMSGATKGDFYIVSTAGTVNFGAGAIQFFVNDRVIYDGSAWNRLSAGDVKSVNGVLPEAGDIKNVISLTQAQYNALSANAKKGKFFIIDNGQTVAQELINDNATATNTTWSSSKITDNLNGALVNYDTKGNQSIIAKTDANLCIPSEQTESINFVAYGSNKNLPTNDASYFIRTQRSSSYIVQFASNVQNDLTKTAPDYTRKAKLSEGTWTFSPWEKVTTETDLADYSKSIGYDDTTATDKEELIKNKALVAINKGLQNYCTCTLGGGWQGLNYGCSIISRSNDKYFVFFQRDTVTSIIGCYDSTKNKVEFAERLATQSEVKSIYLTNIPFLTLREGWELLDIRVCKQGNHYTGDILVHKLDGFIKNNVNEIFADIKSGFVSIKHNAFAIYKNSRYTSTTTKLEVGYNWDITLLVAPNTTSDYAIVPIDVIEV